MLTFSVLIPTDQFVVHSFNNDIQFLPRLNRQLFAAPLFISERGQDGHLVQNLYLPFVLKQIEKEFQFT